MTRSSRAAFALACILVSPPALSAQWGAAVGVRFASGSDGSEANSPRSGFEGRVFFDRSLPASGFALRGELAYNQMQYDRDDGVDQFQIAENGFELVLAGRAELRGALSRAYLTAGPVASYRAACGTSSRFDSNGRVACAEGEVYRTGYALGVGYTWPGERNDVLVEARYMGNITAANGRQLIALSVGLRRKR